MSESFVSAFATLFVIVDPVGTAPLFIALTAGAAAAERRRIAIRASLVAAGVLLVFAAVGEATLSFVGISMSAFRIAGGLLLFLIAVDMLFETRTARRERRVEDERSGPPDDPSVFPLAIPLIAGPGAIAAVILLVGEAGSEPARLATVAAAGAAVLGLQLLLFLAGSPVERALGRTGIMVVTRIMGMLLAALAVQFVLDGLGATGLVAPAGAPS